MQRVVVDRVDRIFQARRPVVLVAELRRAEHARRVTRLTYLLIQRLAGLRRVRALLAARSGRGGLLRCACDRGDGRRGLGGGGLRGRIGAGGRRGARRRVRGRLGRVLELRAAVIRHVRDREADFVVAVVVGAGAAARGHRAFAGQRGVPQRVETLGDARRPVGRVAELRRAGCAARMARGADRLEYLLAGLVRARRVRVADGDLRDRRDAGGNRRAGQLVGAGAGARRVVDVIREQHDDRDGDGEPGDDRRDELAGCLDRGSVGGFAHACLVSVGLVSRYGRTVTIVGKSDTDDYRRKVLRRQRVGGGVQRTFTLSWRGVGTRP